ncbi:MAG: minichromosome maintenance protein MCM [Candidatus Aenigmarchaeota archaeon]|nr:minichromosome maintenance protein MCM [Candidatus Aenigmarchaeota archaeon]
MDLVDRLDEFIREYYYADLLKATKEETALVVDFSILDRFDGPIADQLLNTPEEIISALDAAAERIVDEKIHVRVRNLPESRMIRIRNLRAKHMNRFMTVDAIIKAASEVKPQIYEAIFECPECHAKISVKQDSNIVQKPISCECGRRGDFKLIDKKMYDIRWLTAVEPFEVTTGEQPGQISILLKEDLTTPKMQKKTDPGAKLKITGMMKELPKRIKGKMSTKMDMYIEANHVETSDIEFEDMDISPEDEKKIRDLAADPGIYEKLIASIAPGIYGFEDIKEAITLQLFGGVPHVLPDGSRIRGNIHILITGDPGVGKSVLLKLVSSIVPRGRYVSGSGVSGAGLTATVVKNEAIGGWVLEAGALILCNKGLIAIDEFDKMSRDDQIAMHEATSIETVSIAKASIVATLPAQTAVLAAANPKLGRFDPYVSIAEQINIPETLLSRFDLKFALKDLPDRTKDERITRHIIASRITPDTVEPPINKNLLRKYIAYARVINDVELSQEAGEMLQKFYVDMRNQYPSSEIQVISITLRQYEALIRLAEASAKVRLDNKIRMEDAQRAIKLMNTSLYQLGYDVESGKIDIDKVEGGITATKRRRITVMLGIIDRLQKEVGKEVSIEDIKAEAENQGIEGAEEIIERLQREGTIFTPRPGFIRRV